MRTEQEVLTIALDLYCRWLNRWQEAEDVPNQHRYEPEQFQSGDGGYRFRGAIPMYDTLYLYEVYDGDEGGPHELYVWVSNLTNDLEVTSIVQGFDTGLTIIYREGHFEALPEAV